MTILVAQWPYFDIQTQKRATGTKFISAISIFLSLGHTKTKEEKQTKIEHQALVSEVQNLLQSFEVVIVYFRLDNNKVVNRIYE